MDSKTTLKVIEGGLSKRAQKTQLLKTFRVHLQAILEIFYAHDDDQLLEDQVAENVRDSIAQYVDIPEIEDTTLPGILALEQLLMHLEDQLIESKGE